MYYFIVNYTGGSGNARRTWNKVHYLLNEKNIEYRIVDNNTADIYAELVFSEFAKDCEAAGCTIISMDEHDESLESFYISLVGGDIHE